MGGGSTFNSNALAAEFNTSFFLGFFSPGAYVSYYYCYYFYYSYYNFYCSNFYYSSYFYCYYYYYSNFFYYSYSGVKT